MPEATTMPFLGLQQAPAAPRYGAVPYAVEHTVMYLQASVYGESARKLMSAWAVTYFPPCFQ